MDRKIKIIIIDDDTKLTNLLNKNINEQPDMEVIATDTSGINVIDLIKKHRPDIVLLDDVMPYLDGIGVLEKIISTRIHNKPIFIVLSSLGTEKILKRFTHLGASYCFIKPVDINSVIGRIRDFTESKKIGKIINTTNNSTNSSFIKAKNKYLEKKNKKENLEIMVSIIIREIGIPPHLLGNLYIRESIILAIKDYSILKKITTKLYPEIAQEYNTTPSNVERAIRHGIEVAWGRGNETLIENIFGYTVSPLKGKPTNSEFIAGITDKLIDELKK